MYVNYPELSALYHHGIKGQKWGIVRKKDDPETRLASEKNRLKYDEKIAQINRSSDASIQINKQNNATAIALGKQQLTQALSKDSLMRKESYENRKIKEQKYKTLGMAAVALCFTLRYVSKTVMSGVKK